MRLGDMPIRRKLMTAFLLTSCAVLSLTCTVFITYEILTLRTGMIQGYSTRAQIIAANSTAALAFQVQDDAVNVLSALRTDPRIKVACIYDGQDKVFARYPADAPDSLLPLAPGKTGYRNGHLDIFCPIVQNGRQLGTVYVQSGLSALTDRYWAYAWLSVFVIVAAILLAYLLSRVLQQQISTPILDLAATAQAISEKKDFSVRAKRLSGDELGTLTDTFNQMLETLAERTQMLDLIMQNMSEGIVVADRDGKMTFYNAAEQKISGMTISSKPPSEWAKEYGVFKEDGVTLCPTDEVPLVQAVRGIETNGVVLFLRNPAHPEGIFVSVNGRPMKDEQGELLGGLVVIRDITDEKKAGENQARLAAIVESSSDAIIGKSLDGRIFSWNKAAERIYGYRSEEILGKPIQVLGSSEQAGEFEEILAKIRRGEDIIDRETIRRRKDGILFPISLTVSPIRDDRGNLLGASAVERDITRRKQAEEAIRNEAFINSVLENIPNMVFVKDAQDLRFVVFNKAGEELIGVTKADLAGKNDYDLFPAAQADFFTAKDRKVLDSKKLLDIPEETIQTKSKGERILHTKKIPILDSTGTPKYLLGISEDITEQKQQEILRVQNKVLEASNRELQDFIFVASHDLQEPLRKIQAFGNFLREELGASISNTASDYLGRMLGASQRMGILIEDLLQLTRVTTRAKSFESVDLSQVIEDVKSDMEIRLKETQGRVEAGNLPRLEADAAQMRQLFQNLIGNALKFRRKDRSPLVKIDVENGGVNGRCLIRVKDNGIGFDPKYADKIFNIFQRLHGQEYEGTGIGLAICRKVVERHHGSIRAVSQSGQGAVFEIELPFKQNQSGGTT